MDCNSDYSESDRSEAPSQYESYYVSGRSIGSSQGSGHQKDGNSLEEEEDIYSTVVDQDCFESVPSEEDAYLSMPTPPLEDSCPTSEGQFHMVDQDVRTLYDYIYAGTDELRLEGPLISCVSEDGNRSSMVLNEIVTTETTYSQDLNCITQGYIPSISANPLFTGYLYEVFGNLKDISDFHSVFTKKLDEAYFDPVEVAKCFLKESQRFSSLYSEYCSNFPRAMSVLDLWKKDKEKVKFLQEVQQKLKLSLPLDTYLLKPVQRIMKYHLLLQALFSSLDKTVIGFEMIEIALKVMSDSAYCINEMKRMKENIQRIPEIISRVVHPQNFNLYQAGKLVLEDDFRILGTRTLRHVLLFDKVMLLFKENDDRTLYLKSFYLVRDLVLAENHPKEPLAFEIMELGNPKSSLYITAKTKEVKHTWLLHLKRLVLQTLGIDHLKFDALLGEKDAQKVKNILSTSDCSEKDVPSADKDNLSSHGEDPDSTFIDGLRSSISKQKKGSNILSAKSVETVKSLFSTKNTKKSTGSAKEEVNESEPSVVLATSSAQPCETELSGSGPADVTATDAVTEQTASSYINHSPTAHGGEGETILWSPRTRTHSTVAAFEFEDDVRLPSVPSRHSAFVRIGKPLAFTSDSRSSPSAEFVSEPNLLSFRKREISLPFPAKAHLRSPAAKHSSPVSQETNALGTSTSLCVLNDFSSVKSMWEKRAVVAKAANIAGSGVQSSPSSPSKLRPAVRCPNTTQSVQIIAEKLTNNRYTERTVDGVSIPRSAEYRAREPANLFPTRSSRSPDCLPSGRIKCLIDLYSK